MNATVARYYRRFRRSYPFMLVGHNAQQALSAAKTLARFERLESMGLVRLDTRSDDSHNWDDEEERKRYGDDGAWGVIGQWRMGEDDQWHHADSIWGCVGYNDVTSPYENGYVIDIMGQTIDALRQALSHRRPTCCQPLPHKH